MIQLLNYLLIIISFVWLNLACSNIAWADTESTITQTATQVPRITAVSYVSWWSHDATGYHPAIFLKLENNSGKDLSGVLIQFQGRFTDLHNGYVTIARKETRLDFVNLQQRYTILKGPAAFELPIDENLWPSIECKVMCRVGGVGDEGTQTLLLTRLESITMTDEEAMARLSKQPDIRRSHTPTIHNNGTETHQKQTTANHTKMLERPLSAQALSLSLNGKKLQANKPQKPMASLLGLRGFVQLPGLGDNFLAFDKTFGKAEHWNCNRDWTWVPYQSNGKTVQLFVGAKNHRAKADMIVLKIPAARVHKEAQIIQLAKDLAGPFKSQQLRTSTTLVQYLPAGRVQFTTTSANSYHVLVISPCGATDDNSNYILVVSRLQGDLAITLPSLIKSTSLLSFMTPLFPLGNQ